MKKVGVTGGIGSGKTTICKMFELLGIPIYDADSRAKWLMTYNKSLKQSIKTLLGTESYHRNGRLNRGVVAKKVFSDKKLLSGLNALVHPAVAEDSNNWFENQEGPYAIKEAALMIESGSHTELDYLIVVTCDEEERVRRVIKRDQTNEKAVRSRIANQLDEKTRLKHADFIIDNSGEESVINQVLEIHKRLSAM